MEVDHWVSSPYYIKPRGQPLRVSEIQLSQHLTRQADHVHLPVALDGKIRVLDLPLVRLKEAPVVIVVVKLIELVHTLLGSIIERLPAEHHVGAKEHPILVLEEKRLYLTSLRSYSAGARRPPSSMPPNFYMRLSGG